MFLSVCLYSMLFFQDSPDTVQEEISVVVRQVKVRVVDRKGNPVKGLQKSDFQIRVNGKKDKPVYFEEIDFYQEAQSAQSVQISDTPSQQEILEAEAEGNPISPSQLDRSIIILFDTNMVAGGGFKTLKENIVDFVATLRPRDKVRLYQLGFSTTALTGFTNDKDEILGALEKARWSPFLWQALSQAQDDLVRQAEELTSNHSIGVRNDPSAAERASQTVANIQVGLGQAVAEKGRIKNRHSVRVVNALRGLGHTLRSHSGDKSVFFFSGGGYMTEESIHLFEDVSNDLNWHNITINAFHLQDFTESDMNGLMASSAVGFSALQQIDNMLYNRGSSSGSGVYEPESAIQAQSRALAAATGGAFVHAGNKRKAPLVVPDMAKRSAHHYLITYKPQDATDKLKISLKGNKGKGLEIHYGSERARPKPFSKKSDKEKDADFAYQLVYGDTRFDIDIDWAAKPFQKQEGVYSFPILARMSGPFSTVGYEVGFVALDENHTIMDERKSQIHTTGGDGVMEFYDILATERPAHSIRALVRDRVSGTYSMAEIKLDHPEPGKPAFGPVLLLPGKPGQVYAVHELNQDKLKLAGKKRDRMALDPFAVDGGRMGFTMGPVSMGTPLGLHFQLSGLNRTLDNYSLGCVLKAQGEEEEIDLAVQKSHEELSGQTTVTAAIDISILPAGQYGVDLILQDLESGELVARTSQEFIVAPL